MLFSQRLAKFFDPELHLVFQRKPSLQCLDPLVHQRTLLLELLHISARRDLFLPYNQYNAICDQVAIREWALLPGVAGHAIFSRQEGIGLEIRTRLQAAHHLLNECQLFMRTAVDWK